MCRYLQLTIFDRDIATFQAGIGDKVATFIQWVSTFVFGAIICLARGWQLTLVILTVAPVAAGVGMVVARVRYFHHSTIKLKLKCESFLQVRVLKELLTLVE